MGARLPPKFHLQATNLHDNDLDVRGFKKCIGF